LIPYSRSSAQPAMFPFQLYTQFFRNTKSIDI